jgi:hypothetical protein
MLLNKTDIGTFLMHPVIQCPTCKKPVQYTPDNPYRPFCSKRCRFVDLGQWLEGDYRIADDAITANKENCTEETE